MSVAITIDNVVKRFGKDTIINGLSGFRLEWNWNGSGLEDIIKF